MMWLSVALNERITRIVDESVKLVRAIEKINIFGIDYNKMSEAQQYELGSYVDLMSSSTQLLINPIKGLQPKTASDKDYNDYISWEDRKEQDELCKEHKTLIVSLANFLYKIALNDRDKRLLWKSFRKNKKMLKSMNVSKKDFGIDVIDAVLEALKYKYNADGTDVLSGECNLWHILIERVFCR